MPPTERRRRPSRTGSASSRQLVNSGRARLAVIALDGSAPTTVAIEQLESDQRIGEVGNRPRAKPQRLGDLRSGHRGTAQPDEQLELDCRQERLLEFHST